MVRSHSTLLSTIGVLLLLCVYPAVSAADTGAGVILDASAPDAAFGLERFSVAICFIDQDGNGYSIGDPVVLDVSGSCSGDSSPADLRLVNLDDHQAGRRLGSGPDANKPLSTPSGPVSFYYHDTAGNNVLDEGDIVYVNIVNPTTTTVDVGDIRLTPLDDVPAGEPVRSGDDDQRAGITSLGTAAQVIGLVDTDGDDTFDDFDLLYLNADAGTDELVEVGDLRLSHVDEMRPFGSLVRFGDADGSGTYTTALRSPCFTDDDESGAYSLGDGLYIDLSGDCDATVSAGDVRLASTAGGPAGSHVSGGDVDAGRAFSALTADVAWSDSDGDGRYEIGEPAFIDLIARSDDVVDAGDIRLTPRDGVGGGRVDGDHPDRGLAIGRLGLFSNLFSYVSTAGGMAPSASDALYLNMDLGGGEGVEPGDIRLVPVAGFPFGGAAELATGEVLPVMRSTSASVCVTTSDSSNTYRAGDAVYLVLSGGCPSQVTTGHLRLRGTAGFEAGSVVRASDSDVGGTLRAPSTLPGYKHFDADGDGAWSYADTLYLDMVGASTDQVHVGDVRLTPYAGDDGGKIVVSDDRDLALPLRLLGNVATLTVYVDSDNDATFGPLDVAYLNVDNQGTYVSLLDVRLGHLPAVASTSQDTEREPGTATSTDTDDATATETETVTDPVSETEKETDAATDPTPSTEDGPVRTSAPGFVLSLLALLGVTAWARQRRP